MCIRRRTILAAAGLLASGSLAACTGSAGGKGGAGGGGGAQSLTYAFFAPAASFPSLQMDEWSKLINERTDGEVSVETFPGGTLLSAGDIYDGVTQGVV